MLIIAGHVEVDPTRRDEYVSAFADMVDRARRTEGCFDLAITGDSVDPSRVNNFERWQSAEALQVWRDVCDPPDLDIEILSDHVSLFDADGQRSPF